jgi:hypothetical protein
MSKIGKIKLYTPLPQYKRKQFNWHYFIAILITILITGAIVRFADAVHYNSVDNQISRQDNQVETKEGKDIHRLMNNEHATLQCSQFLSSFAQQVCSTHNQQFR